MAKRVCFIKNFCWKRILTFAERISRLMERISRVVERILTLMERIFKNPHKNPAILGDGRVLSIENIRQCFNRLVDSFDGGICFA